MRALSIRQPFAELILRGMKTVEYRSRMTHIIGERFWIYASKKQLAAGSRQLAAKKIVGDNIVVPDAPPAPWMVELANGLRLFPRELPTGVIVGSAIIERVSLPDASAGDGLYRWHLVDVERAKRLRPPKRHPQPVWFEPF